MAPSANLLTVIDSVHKVFPSIWQQLPEGLHGRIVYDATQYVNSSISEVIITLIEALAHCDPGDLSVSRLARSVIIPTVAMPLSLIGTFFIMLALGYTINLLTLLAWCLPSALLWMMRSLSWKTSTGI